MNPFAPNPSLNNWQRNFGAQKPNPKRNATLDDAIQAAKAAAEGNLSTQTATTSSAPSSTLPSTPPIPRAKLSARDAINAAFGKTAPKPIMRPLAPSQSANSSAPNATLAHGELERAKSASRLHKGFIQKSLESTRPSASALLKSNDDQKETPVVRTSLKLGAEALPKKPVVTLPPNARMTRAAKSLDKPAKKKRLRGSARAKALEKRSIDAQVVQIPIKTKTEHTISVHSADEIPTNASRQISAKATDRSAPLMESPKALKAAKAKAPKRLARKSLGVAKKIAITTAADEATAPMKATTLSDAALARAVRPSSSVRKKNLDIKRPVATSRRARPARATHPTANLSSPLPATSSDSASTAHSASSERPTASARPTPRRPKPELRSSSPDDLGVIEDYKNTGEVRPKENDSNSSVGLSARNLKNPKVHKAEDSRRTLGKQSPFFLKSVSVEKRPLSHETAGTGHIATMPRGVQTGKATKSPDESVKFGAVRTVSRRSVFGKSSSKKADKSDPHRRDLTSIQPTVMMPSGNRSTGPLIFLVFLTVLLGAAVGAAAYLCFYQ